MIKETKLKHQTGIEKEFLFMLMYREILDNKIKTVNLEMISKPNENM